MGKPVLVLVGGFLGAGKTTLILCAGKMLQRQGTRVAVITNDQGHHLIDTRQTRSEGIDAAEIGGGCFCCRFSEFIDAAVQLIDYRPEVIFAEPVGSCTDLAATVLRPLREFHADQFRIAPLTVVIDPAAARRVSERDSDPNIRFLFESQIHEADLLCYTKTDVEDEFPLIGNDQPLRVSGTTGAGVSEWLDKVLSVERVWDRPAPHIDYDRYAAAEAALGWLNARVEIGLEAPASPSHLIGPLLERIDEQLSAAHAGIAHLKLFDQTGSSYLKAAIVRNGQEPSVEGDLLGPAELRHELLINLRALARPDLLRSIVESVLLSLPGYCRTDIQAFAPGYPNPQHR